MTTETQTLGDPKPDLIPPTLVRAMILLIVCAVGLTSFAVLTGRDHEAAPLQLGDAPIVAERTFVLTGNTVRGSALVAEVDGTPIQEFGTNEGGFLSTMVRVLGRSRMQRGVAFDAPVRLVQFENGQLSLIDTVDGTSITLNGFGRDNEAAFAALLEG